MKLSIDYVHITKFHLTQLYDMFCFIGDYHCFKCPPFSDGYQERRRQCGRCSKGSKCDAWSGEEEEFTGIVRRYLMSRF